MAAIKRLKVQPDVFLADAQGWAHPYHCGFASLLGLALGKPTVGAAKSKLTGEPKEVDGRTLLFENHKIIGEEVSTREGSKKIYVSIGHMMSLETCVKIVQQLSRTRIPEPLQQAHKLAVQKRLELLTEAK